MVLVSAGIVRTAGMCSGAHPLSGCGYDRPGSMKWQAASTACAGLLQTPHARSANPVGQRVGYTRIRTSR